MDSNNAFPHRWTLRLPEFDYSQPGAYSVTIVTQDRILLFGEILNGEMILNEVGKSVAELWLSIPEHFSNVELGEYVVMPNHIHGIISINNVGATHAVKTMIVYTLFEVIVYTFYRSNRLPSILGSP